MLYYMSQTSWYEVHSFQNLQKMHMPYNSPVYKWSTMLFMTVGEPLQRVLGSQESSENGLNKLGAGSMWLQKKEA